MKNLFHANDPAPDPETATGCGFMQGMLNGLADGTASGVGKWYAEQHVGACPVCAAALARKKRELAGAAVPETNVAAETVQHSCEG